MAKSMDSSEIGSRGENITNTFLVGKGHRIINRNYRMRFGEIDIVSKKDGILYFVEVKTIAKEGNSGRVEYRVEERVNRGKLEKLSRVIEHYLLHECRDVEPRWEFWVITVTLDVAMRRAFVKVIPETLTG